MVFLGVYIFNFLRGSFEGKTFRQRLWFFMVSFQRERFWFMFWFGSTFYFFIYVSFIFQRWIPLRTFPFIQLNILLTYEFRSMLTVFCWWLWIGIIFDQSLAFDLGDLGFTFWSLIFSRKIIGLPILSFKRRTYFLFQTFHPFSLFYTFFLSRFRFDLRLPFSWTIYCFWLFFIMLNLMYLLNTYFFLWYIFILFLVSQFSQIASCLK